MKILQAIILIFIFFSPVLANTPEDVKKADKVQKENIRKLEAEITDYHKEIQKTYEYIKATGLVRYDKTRIPLRSHDIKFFSRREEHIYNSELHIFWTKEGKIKFLEFRERIAVNRTFQRKYRLWVGQLLADNHDDDATKIKGYSVDFIAYLGLEYGNLTPENFRVSTAFDTKNDLKFPDMPEISLKTKMRTIYIKYADQRIKVLQEYLNLLHLAYLRINFFTRNAQTGNEKRLKYLLP